LGASVRFLAVFVGDTPPVSRSEDRLARGAGFATHPVGRFALHLHAGLVAVTIDWPAPPL
jgi:hypothetical protein